jgi:predicted outer membrane lipoprotein
MKQMIRELWVLGIAVACAVAVGFIFGLKHMQREAVEVGHAHWVLTENLRVQFVWGAKP